MISGKWCKIGYKLVLFTNRKSHTGFRLLPKLVTSKDHERPPNRAISAVAELLTALHVMQTRFCDENSVRPSAVCPSHAWIVTKWKKDRSRFLYHTKEHLA